MTTQNGRAFNEWLRAQLKAKKMSQRQLAQQSGVDHSTISRLIRGDRMPSLGTATKLARGLRELRDDADTPQYLGLVAAGATNPTARVEYALRADERPERAPGPPDHGVLPRRADAPPRPDLPAAGEAAPTAARARTCGGMPHGAAARSGPASASRRRPGSARVRPVLRPSSSRPNQRATEHRTRARPGFALHVRVSGTANAGVWGAGVRDFRHGTRRCSPARSPRHGAGRAEPVSGPRAQAAGR